jgi:TatD DNase family protein
VYPYQNNLYINLTSRCPTACRFCVKFTWEYQYRGRNLKLPADPSVDEILAAAGTDLSGYGEMVFCGYGESTYRLKEMEELARAFRARGARRIRLNTVGYGNLIHGRSIGADLARFLDVVSVSLNTADPEQHEALHRPLPEFKGKGFAGVVDFIRDCVGKAPEVVVTAVESPEVDTTAVRCLAESLGASFRLRPLLEDYEAA